MPSTDVLMSRESRPGVPLVSITVLSGFCGRGSSIRQGPSSQDASSTIVAAVGHTRQPVPRAGLGCAGLTASARKPCQRVRSSGAVLGSAGWATGRKEVCSSPFVCTFPLVPPALCQVALGGHRTRAHAVLGKSWAGQHGCDIGSLLLWALSTGGDVRWSRLLRRWFCVYM